MKITIESTGRMETVDGVPARVWKGTSESGVPVQCWIPIIGADQSKSSPEQIAQFETELKEIKTERQLVSFDMRMVL